uniref:Uncharacterized protein n=1 Tax=Cacopsylla melanoneura TaxID=428564 RepID=A0A8D8YN48_9HEMI
MKNFQFNRELELDQYDDKFYSKFRNIQKLTLTNSIQKEIIPQEKLSVLLSLEVLSIDKEKINLRECKRLQNLSCKKIENIDKEDFPVSLKKINFQHCANISDINMNHLINLREINCTASSITDAAINKSQAPPPLFFFDLISFFFLIFFYFFFFFFFYPPPPPPPPYPPPPPPPRPPPPPPPHPPPPPPPHFFFFFFF